jgi:hypothetical protein
MKIEVCEQMIGSWLKYEKGCQIVQTNWQPSPIAICSEEDYQNVEDFMNEVRDHVTGTELEIFKKSTAQQFISQCEIDVVGLRVIDGNIDALFFVDSAFHEAGLSYANTVGNVIKKILRAIAVSNIFFKSIPAQIIFASPFCRDSVQLEIEKHISLLTGVVKKYYPDMEIILLFNADFSRQIYIPLKHNIGRLNSDNELFMRSMKLISVCERFEAESCTLAYRDSSSKAVTDNMRPTKLTYSKTQRGGNEAVVFGALKKIIDDNRMTDALLANLQQTAYTKQYFSMPTFPFLITSENFKHSGFQQNRFYRNRITIQGNSYMVCNQWIPERIRRLNNWLDQVLK